MDLKTYLEMTGESYGKFAKQIDRDTAHVWRIAHGKTWPSRDTSLEIAAVTSGMVLPEDQLASFLSPELLLTVNSLRATNPLVASPDIRPDENNSLLGSPLK